jgi:hypothetical protein
MRLARLEGLDAHAIAVGYRLGYNGAPGRKDRR